MNLESISKEVSKKFSIYIYGKRARICIILNH